jgi:hypothetical protein
MNIRQFSFSLSSFLLAICSTMLSTTPIFAQTSRVDEVLNNTTWQVVPGATVGRNPIETQIDVNNIVRVNNVVTFDITGYQGFYYRVQGDCNTQEINLLRRGRVTGGDVTSFGAMPVNYQPIDGSEDPPGRIFDFHHVSFDFACRITSTQ